MNWPCKCLTWAPGVPDGCYLFVLSQCGRLLFPYCLCTSPSIQDYLYFQICYYIKCCFNMQTCDLDTVPDFYRCAQYTPTIALSVRITTSLPSPAGCYWVARGATHRRLAGTSTSGSCGRASPTNCFLKTPTGSNHRTENTLF